MSDDRSRTRPSSQRVSAAPGNRASDGPSTQTTDEAAQRRLATTEALFDCVDLLCERLKTANDR